MPDPKPPALPGILHALQQILATCRTLDDVARVRRTAQHKWRRISGRRNEAVSQAQGSVQINGACDERRRALIPDISAGDLADALRITRRALAERVSRSSRLFYPDKPIHAYSDETVTRLMELVRGSDAL